MVFPHFLRITSAANLATEMSAKVSDRNSRWSLNRIKRRLSDHSSGERDKLRAHFACCQENSCISHIFNVDKGGSFQPIEMH